MDKGIYFLLISCATTMFTTYNIQCCIDGFSTMAFENEMRGHY